MVRESARGISDTFRLTCWTQQAVEGIGDKQHGVRKRGYCHAGHIETVEVGNGVVVSFDGALYLVFEAIDPTKSGRQVAKWEHSTELRLVKSRALTSLSWT